GLHERPRCLRGRDGSEGFDRGDAHLCRRGHADGLDLEPRDIMKLARLILIFLAGALFGTGLAVSGMTDPARVIGFLDVFGSWDPALLVVMAGAVGVYGLGMLILRRFQNQNLNLPSTASFP